MPFPAPETLLPWQSQWGSPSGSMDPRLMFEEYVQRFNEFRDLILTKLEVDSRRLCGLENLLRATIEAKGLKNSSDLDFTTMSVDWWKASVESELEKLDKEVTVAKSIKLGVGVIELAKRARGQKEASTCAGKLEELDTVLASLQAMKATMARAVNLIGQALGQVHRWAGQDIVFN